MTDKEILAELKVCYELLNDIRENNEGRFNDDEDTILWKMGEQIDDLYSKVYHDSPCTATTPAYVPRTCVLSIREPQPPLRLC